MTNLPTCELGPIADDFELRHELAELVRRTLLEIGQISEITDRIKDVSERLSHCTPPPIRPVEPSR